MTFFQKNFGQIWEMFGVSKPFLKGVGTFIRENTLYISLFHYTGIIASSRWIRFQLPISDVFWQASPVSVWACEGAELHVSHTERTCLARPVVCLNRTLTTFENTMLFLADGQVVFSKIFDFLHYLPDCIGSKWVKWYWGTYVKNTFYNLRTLPIETNTNNIF